MKKSSMASSYKILEEMTKYDGGLNRRKLKTKFPFLNVEKLLEMLKSLGYVSHKITAYRVVEKRDVRIKHDQDSLWYPTELGLTALEQYRENNPPQSKSLVIGLVVVIGVCAVIFVLIATSSV